MVLLGDRVLVERIEKEVTEGFQTVEVTDKFINTAKVVGIGSECIYLSVQSRIDTGTPGIGATPAMVTTTGTGVYYASDRPTLSIGDTIIFAKYSPHTHDIEHEGKSYKSVRSSDIIAIL